jgi:hypothetical protein
LIESSSKFSWLKNNLKYPTQAYRSKIYFKLS